LVEFLLARVAEDKAVAREVMGRAAADPHTDATEVFLYANEAASSGSPIVATTPARVLAECEAKRQAVAIFQNHPGADPRDDRRWNEYAGMNSMLCALALPYADHPDYQEAWRP